MSDTLSTSTHPATSGSSLSQSNQQPSGTTRATASLLDPSNFPQALTTAHTHTELCYNPLDIPAALKFTRSPTAGANVLFLGTTRNNFDDRPVTRLSYSAYPALALKSLSAIAEDVRHKHGLEKVYLIHRLGEVGVEEESIAVSVSSGHRQAGWRGAEEILERVKQRAEIWKREWFGDTGEVEEGVWRANRDRDATGKPVQNMARESIPLGKDDEQAVTQKATSVDGGSSQTSPQTISSPDFPAAPNKQNNTFTSTAQLTGKTYQTSQELDDDIAKHMAAMAQRLKM